jgi:hypothetical protein
MVELEPELSAHLTLYGDTIERKATGSTYKVLSAEAYSKEGLNPNLVLFDEVHVQPHRELWDVMALAAGARPQPLMVGITTAGARYDATGRDSLCYGLYEYGKRIISGELEDPSFFMAWWEPRDSLADHRDPTTWREGNPGFGDLVGAEDFEATVRRTPELEFRAKRCNQFVSGTTAWLPRGAWDGCADPSVLIPMGAEAVLGFDGSYNGDSTALVVVSVAPVPHVAVVDCWERPPDARDEWAVDILDVEDAIRGPAAAGRSARLCVIRSGGREATRCCLTRVCRWWSFRRRLRGWSRPRNAFMKRCSIMGSRIPVIRGWAGIWRMLCCAWIRVGRGSPRRASIPVGGSTWRWPA